MNIYSKLRLSIQIKKMGLGESVSNHMMALTLIAMMVAIAIVIIAALFVSYTERPMYEQLCKDLIYYHNNNEEMCYRLGVHP